MTESDRLELTGRNGSDQAGPRHAHRRPSHCLRVEQRRSAHSLVKITLISCGPVADRRGGIFPVSTETRRPCTTGIAAGQAMERGSGFWTNSVVAPMRTRARSGRSGLMPGSMPGWSGRTSTPPVPAMRRQLMSTRRSWRPRWWTQGAGSNDRKPAAKPSRETLGRSRGGLTSKIHLAADTRCRAISRVTTAGHRHDSLAFEPVMAGIRIGRRGPGRPRSRPVRVLGDKAYSSRAIRSHLRRRRITATIPEPSDQRDNRLRRGSRGGRAPQFDAEIYKKCNVVERAGARPFIDPHGPACCRVADPLLHERNVVITLVRLRRHTALLQPSSRRRHRNP
jgi:hypothetical protein